MIKWMVTLVVVVGCGSPGEFGPDAAVIPPPQMMTSCAAMGCDPTLTDRVCAETGACACRPEGQPREAPKVSCAPRCEPLGCAALACDTSGLCTCELPAIGYVTCEG